MSLILPRLGYPLISIYSTRESPGNPREFPKIKEKWCIMQGTIPRILIMQLKQVLVFDIILNVQNKKHLRDISLETLYWLMFLSLDMNCY